jgi:hypothetical protein
MTRAALCVLISLAIPYSSGAAAPDVDSPAYRVVKGSPADGLRCDLRFQERRGWHPGEPIGFDAIIRVVAADGLLLDGLTARPYMALYVRTPDGKLYRLNDWPGPVRAPPSNRLKRIARGSEMQGAQWRYRLTRDAADGIDADTRKAVKVSLRAEGEYAFWATYGVPRNPAVPQAWSGTAASGTVKVRVTELPPEKRRGAPTAAQEKLLTSLLEQSDNVFQELSNAITLAENEGLAQRMLRLARERPERRDNLLWFVRERAQDGEGRLAIDGPYLADFVRLIVDDLESGGVIDPGDKRPRRDWVYWPARFVLEYAELHPEAAPLRDRVLALARKNARIENVKPDWGLTPCGLSIAEVWDVLLRAGVLRDGMKLTEAEELLGQSNWGRSPYGEERAGVVHHHWRYPSKLRKAPAMLGAAVKDGLVVKFGLHGL